MPPKRKAAPKDSTANLGFEAKLWLTADKLRNNMDAAEYKHVVLGLIFLKYISDTFEEHRAKLLAGEGDYEGANPEDPDEYKAENVFWVPTEARWSHLQASAKQPTIGKTVDDAMVAIERDNPRLKGVLPKDYARPALDVFAGYLLLDAWVANQDRHHQNWGAIRDGEKLLLAPTYDHGSSLARNLTDEERRDRLRTKDKGRAVAHFAARARSGFYRGPEAKKTLYALEVFEEFAEHAPKGAAIWKESLSRVIPEAVETILNRIPPQRMTPITREFTFELLMINQQRLLHRSTKP